MNKKLFVAMALVFSISSFSNGVEASTNAEKNAEIKVTTAAKKTNGSKESSKPKLIVIKKKTEVKVTKKATTTKKIASRGTTHTLASGSGKTIASADANTIISNAKRYMGVRYVFGGTTARGFDCSGFTAHVFNLSGISLPHSAALQARMGIAVSKSELKTGDLVFFETYKPGISHCGIYIGGGNFIHASSSAGITISKLSDRYYSTRYRGATRILK